MLKVKNGNYQCPNCERFKLKITKTEKFYRVYKCDECETKYRHSRLSKQQITEEIVKAMRKLGYDCFCGTVRDNHRDRPYYVYLQNVYGSQLTFSISDGIKEKFLVYDEDDPEKFIKAVYVYFTPIKRSSLNLNKESLE